MAQRNSLYLWAGLFALVITILRYVTTALRLSSIPGPFLARFTKFYRLSLVQAGNGQERYRKLHEKYGPIVRTGPNHVSISDVSMIPVIYGIGSKFFKTEWYDCVTPQYQGSYIDAIFGTQNINVHRGLKGQVSQLYSMTNMKNYEGHVNECSDIFVEAMRDLQGQHVDIGPWFQWYAFDVIGNITFQHRFGFMEQRKDVDGMMEGLDDAFEYTKLIQGFPNLHKYLIGSRNTLWIMAKIGLLDPVANFIKITENEITQYDLESKQNSRTDFLAQIRAKQSKDHKISYRDVISHLLTNIMAGSDTTAISLRAIFYYTLKNPSVYKKLLAELDEADKRGELSTNVTFDESLKLPYLQAVIKEAMRMHPAVGWPLERYVPEGGAEICGVHLPAGTVVGMSAPTIQCDQSTYGADAHEFRPERWLEADPTQLKLMERAYFAFGHGSRTCIGKNISIMEMGKFVPQVFRIFDVTWVSPNPEWKTNTAWFWKQRDMLVKFDVRRKD